MLEQSNTEQVHRLPLDTVNCVKGLGRDGNCDVVSDPGEINIVVMGATGTGKSTFINLVSCSDLVVGDGLRSCTSKVTTGRTFGLSGKRVTLVDTPGFDDTFLSDTDILKMIAVYLSSTYESGYKLNGVIYMHRISDLRVGGTSRRNFNMFRKLCGDDTLCNVVIVTTFWNEVDRRRGEARERQLCTDEILFAPVLQAGAAILRHDGTRQSALAVLERFINNTPRALLIQRELVDERLDIVETAAGMELTRELAALQQRHAEEVADLQNDMRQALEKKDERARKELEHVRRGLLERIERIENDRRRLSREYAEAREMVDCAVRNLQETLRATKLSMLRQLAEEEMVHSRALSVFQEYIEEKKRVTAQVPCIQAQAEMKAKERGITRLTRSMERCGLREVPEDDRYYICHGEAGSSDPLPVARDAPRYRGHLGPFARVGRMIDTLFGL